MDFSLLHSRYLIFREKLHNFRDVYTNRKKIVIRILYELIISYNGVTMMHKNCSIELKKIVKQTLITVDYNFFL
ncbi:hypothetical protein PRUPE_1G542500 [Prunus persica]|uniref:Uncharacterized protein n=1 Tax=Prunus persica TaxID=3760 RepID=M5XA83_PRUPE|nr:hypothetical protein PRUPE_1G542500 [Prunus persica]